MKFLLIKKLNFTDSGRKFAYNILRLAIIKEHPEWGMQGMMDYFSDHPEMTQKYIFSSIASFY